MPKILIIDDDQQICKTLVFFFKRMGHEVSDSFTLKQGLSKISAESFDVVFLDVILPDGNGLKAIKTIRERPFAPEVIIMTGEGNPDGAELAMNSRAWDYIQKTGSQKEIKLSLDRALEYRAQKQTKFQKITIKRNNILGESPLILKCFEKVSRAAGNDLPILITGETGTGKELFSRAIHNNSNRSLEEFIIVDCTALPKYLIESTLFGHTKGAFTGADSDNPGLLEMADKGTLFLDEVGELSLDIQKKLLRALQEKRFRPVGSKKEIKSDFRLISATHQDLSDMVSKNQFREDLFFRMFSINIHLPPLKDREGDINIITDHHLSHKENACTMSQEFIEELQMYNWPGNVRELINTIDQACSDSGNNTTLFPHHLPAHIRAFNIKNKFSLSPKDDISIKKFPSITKKSDLNLNYKIYTEKAQHEFLLELLSATKGSLKEACKVSGLSRSQLYRLMKKHHLKRN